MHIWKDRKIIYNSQMLPLIPKCPFMIAFLDYTSFFFFAKLLFSYIVIHLYVALKTTCFTISRLCFCMIYFYYKGICQKIFIMYVIVVWHHKM